MSAPPGRDQEADKNVCPTGSGQGVEEAVANALCAGEEMTGRAGHRVPGLPRDRVAGFFRAGDAG